MAQSKTISFPEFWGVMDPSEKKTIGRPRLVVVGHRGLGKNVAPGVVPAGGLSKQPTVRENTIKSFAAASESGADFVEFDAQVTKDGEVILFHDDVILAEGEKPKAIGELTLEEFRSYGLQAADKMGKKLMRHGQCKKAYPWTAAIEDPLCTLSEAFERVPESCGFNVEVKFGHSNWSKEAEVRKSVKAIVQTVQKHAGRRKVYYSSFHPEAVVLLRNLQSDHPVFFLTCGGRPVWDNPTGKSVEIALRLGLGRTAEAAMRACGRPLELSPIYDTRLVFVEDAIRHAVSHGLHGVVSEVKAIVSKPDYAKAAKDANLQLLTYGNLNNVADIVRLQFDHGVDGVIVDHVKDIVEASHNMAADALPKIGGPLMSPER